MDPDMDMDDDQKSKKMALKGLIAHLGYEDDPDPDSEMDGLLSSDKDLAQKMKKKGGGGGMGGMMGGGGGGGMDLSSLTSLMG